MEINVSAVLVAAVSSFVLGGVLSIDGGYHTLQFVLYGAVLGLWH